MGGEEAGTSVSVEPMLGYHPGGIGFLTRIPKREVGHRQTGSLTGAVASERVSEALKGSLKMDGNHLKECKGRRELDCDTDGWSRYESRT